MDYYKALTQIINDSDQIVLPDPIVVQYYLAYKFLLKLNNGEETPPITAMRDKFIEGMNKMKNRESVNRNFIFNTDLRGAPGY